VTDKTDKQTEPAAPSSQDGGERLIAWARTNSQFLTAAVTVLLVVVAGVWFVGEYRARTALAAQSALDQARLSVQTENYPLAASDLARLIDSYGGTGAAQEAVLLLARVRLFQGQPEVAAQELRAALAEGLSTEFRAPAYAILGVALENAGSHAEAADAYREASRAAVYEFLTAQYLVDAARAALAAGDSAAALADYTTVLEDYAESPSVMEAQVRSGELAARR
jgi:predicted negative regulator of RcsB-dependent stress response